MKVSRTGRLKAAAADVEVAYNAAAAAADAAYAAAEKRAVDVINYILNKRRKPVRCKNAFEWERWFATADRHVARDIVTTDDGEVLISTVFLGIDYSFGQGPPLLYETMVFGGAFNDAQERYATRKDAVKGHKRWVKRVKDNEPG